jgi:phosphate transport system ATP-binding protein
MIDPVENPTKETQTPTQMAPAQAPLLETRDLSVHYGRTQALRNVNIQFREKIITSLIGPSGCGKSTLLRCFNRLNDLIENVSLKGQVLINGQDINDPEVDVVNLRKNVGMVFQRTNPFPKTVHENVAFGLKVHGMKDRDEIDRIVEESLKAAALWDEVKDRLYANALELSGGQQQRLCIARAIAIKPRILLMDEPAASLDPVATAYVEELILDLKKDYTIVLVTHNMQQAARISDYTAFFYLGELVEYSETGKLFTTPENRKTEDYVTGRFG